VLTCGTGQPSILPKPIDTSIPAPYSFDRSVVFVCVDAESFERAHHKITEIGVATLDTRDLSGIAPGPDGENWRSKIHARHFRVQEHAHLINSDFVVGCPDRFDFGQSEWVGLNEAPIRVAECFKPPFSARSIADQESTGNSNIATTDEQRNLIFLGHDTLSDIRYLQQLGFDPLKLPNILEAQDTATMYRVWRREQQTTKLGRILYDFDIPGFNLHNAGNDAVFTVQAMLGICVREATLRGSPENKEMRDEQKVARLAQAQAEAKERAEDFAAGWSDHELDGDGGAPEPIVIKENPNPPFAGAASGSKPTNNSGVGRSHRGAGRGVRESSDSSNGRYQSRGTFYEAQGGGYPYPARLQPSRQAGGQGRGSRGGRGHAREAADSRPPKSSTTSESQEVRGNPMEFSWAV
jgi:hypothetical protein